MVSIRPFEENDTQRMLEIEGLCPQGNDKWAMGVDKKADAVARYRMYDNWKIFVAEEGGEAVSWTGMTLKNGPAKEGRYAYLAEVVVHPGFQRRGIAASLVKEAEKEAKVRGAGHIYCYIYEPNDSSKSLFKSLGYSGVADVKVCVTSVYKRAKVSDKYSIEAIERDEIPDAVGLINEHNKGHAHFVPYTKDSFESNASSIPAYGLDNFWVAKEDGKIVACAGLWDSSALADLYYAKEPLALKIMRAALKVAGSFSSVPEIPAEGERFKMHMVTDFAFEPGASDAALDLMMHFNNVLLEAKRECFAPVLDPKDPLFNIVQKIKPQNDPWTVFARSFEGKLPEFSPYYVDIKDMIP